MSAWPKVNPDCFISKHEASAARRMEETLIRVAHERGITDHPALSIARQNLATLEAYENEHST